jgi:hypothetical protein
MSEPCQINGKPDPSEFEFFQQLVNNQDTAACCGPLDYIVFSDYALEKLNKALEAGGIIFALDGHHHGMLDSGDMSIGMCAKHWLMHIQFAGKQGINANNESWILLATHLFKLVCQNNKWDHKELVNYLRSYTQLRKSQHD